MVEEIDKYSVHVYAGRRMVDIVKQANSPITLPVAKIDLTGNRKTRGEIFFWHDGTDLEPPKLFPGTPPTVSLHYNISRFDAIMDILREEGPIFLIYENQFFAGIRTGWEEPGEDEGV